MTRLYICFLLLFPFPLSPLVGAINIQIQEIGNDVVANVSGSANLTGLSFSANQSGSAFLRASSSVSARFGGGINVDWDLYSGASGPAAIGPGTSSFSILSASQGSGSGPRVGISSNSIILPDGYIDGASITASTTWLNQDFSSMGLAMGDYTWTWSSDSLNISVVPEPAYSAILIGFLAVFLVYQGRKKIPTL